MTIFAGYRLIDASGNVTETATKIINMGDWNMDSTASLAVAHGLTLANIVAVSAMIRNDADTVHYPLTRNNSNGDGSVNTIDVTNVNMTRKVGGVYDSVNFDSTSFNRGWVFVVHTI